MTPSWEESLLTDPLVRAAYKRGCSLQKIICLLVERDRKLMKELEKLDRIAPKKYRMPDGRIFIWRCPDHEVPDYEENEPSPDFGTWDQREVLHLQAPRGGLLPGP